MLYKITKQALLNIDDAYVFYFSAGPYAYLSKRTAGDDPNGVLEYYVPDSEEAQTMLTEYQAFCTDTNQQTRSDLVSTLSTLDGHKDALLADINLKSAGFENNLNKDMYFTSSLGFKVNGDRRTKDNLQDLIAFFELQAKGSETIDYRDYDNKLQKLTKANLQLLLMEHVGNGQNLYDQKWQKQQAIEAAESFDDLHALSTDFVMMDFTPEA